MVTVGSVGGLFAPLVMPLVALLGSLAYFYQRQLCGLGGAGHPDDHNDNEEGITRPLITEVTDDDLDVYPGFSSPDVNAETETETASQSNEVAA